ncbi:MAG TPA: hypothetical protein VFW50_34485 [Streptosporangiaceae bacterium]|nr:hypothetical protein [Streptosporangiaceae bacterium]
MLTVLILVAAAIGGSILILLVVVVVAIRQEPRDIEMSNVAPSQVAVRGRRLLGVSLRRPAPATDHIDGHNEQPPGAWPTAAWTDVTPPRPGRRR